MARRGPGEDPKAAALREARCLNPHPEQVTNEAFLAEQFFDACDVVQVKYEMVRAVTVDGMPVTAAAAAFGYSRPSYYQAAAALAGSGLEGLVPDRPGPRRAHKLAGSTRGWPRTSRSPPDHGEAAAGRFLAGASLLLRDAGQDLVGVGTAAGPGELPAAITDRRTAHGGSSAPVGRAHRAPGLRLLYPRGYISGTRGVPCCR